MDIKKITRGKARSVECLTLGRKYRSIKEASEETGVSSTLIAQVCQGRGRSAGKCKETGELLRWVYSDASEEKKEDVKKKRVGKEKEVLCITTGVLYKSVAGASRETGANRSVITQVCKGKKRSAGVCNESGKRLEWRYVEDGM